MRYNKAMKLNVSDKWIIGLFLVSILAVVGATGYKFLWQKNYTFLVEQACDPATEQCYHRDCSDGSCPPDNLSDYKIMQINAGDFSKCSDDSCATECASGAIKCTPLFCDASSTGDICNYVNNE